MGSPTPSSPLCLGVRLLSAFDRLGVVSSRLPDGLTRRGDINLLMLGDPGTAKSQLLKFVERCAPIGVAVVSAAPRQHREGGAMRD